MKTYEVNMDFNASFTKNVRAKTKAEARKKTWEWFCKTVKGKRKWVEFYVDEVGL